MDDSHPFCSMSIGRSIHEIRLLQTLTLKLQSQGHGCDQRTNKQRVLMHRHRGWNVRHGLCHIYMRYLYIYELFIAFVCFVHYCNVMVYLVYCVASGKQEKVQACLVTLWLFIISCHSVSKTTLGSLCSWKPAWSLKKRPHSMCLKPFVKMCIFVVIQIFWSLRKYREQ